MTVNALLKLNIPECVVVDYIKLHNVERNFAEDIFLELKKFLYVASISTTRCAPSKIVDAAWHVFLEREQEYTKFFASAGIKYVNHVVSNKAPVSAYETTRSMIKEIFKNINDHYWPHQANEITCGACHAD